MLLRIDRSPCRYSLYRGNERGVHFLSQKKKILAHTQGLINYFVINTDPPFPEVLLVSFQASYPEAGVYRSADLIGSFPSGGEGWQWDNGCLKWSLHDWIIFLLPHHEGTPATARGGGRGGVASLCGCSDGLCVCETDWKWPLVCSGE